MSAFRNSSLDPVNIADWRWTPILQLTIKALSRFQLDPYPIPTQFLEREETSGSKSNPFRVRTITWACKTNKLRQARAVCLHAGRSASVFNFVISPCPNFDLPFFGADFVTLPSGNLLALDFQPALKSDKLHTDQVWNRLLPIHRRWQDLVPDGGPIPIEAEPYFSPGMLWTRFPLGNKAEELISSVILPAYNEYLMLYLQLVSESKMISLSRSEILKEGQKRYMKYRSEKDPARGMLTRFYGSQWTESYIKDVLFDL